MLVLNRRPHETVVSLSIPSSDEAHVPAAEPPAAGRLAQLVQKRLDVARLGLTELRRRLALGQEEDAEVILNKIDEDLHLLLRRLR